jgi:phosphatidylglycerophosphatase A
LGIGRLTPAPGTVGTLWGLPIAWAILQLPHPALQAAVIALLCLLGIPICDVAAKQFGLKDPGMIVWDEFVTLPIVYLGCSPTVFREPLFLVAGFCFHRLFDISKLPPGRQLERLPGGLGIVADDIAAGLYGLAALTVLRTVVAHWS